MIRIATMEDAPALAAIGRKMHASSNYARLVYDEAKVQALIEALVESGFAMVAMREGEIVGGMIGTVYQPYFTTDLVASDLALFIDDDYRGGADAVRLVKAFDDWALVQPGVKQIRPGSTIGGDTSLVSKLYKHEGYQVAGAVFMKEV
jgi:GNAT superfamily N-acetyltransferase